MLNEMDTNNPATTITSWVKLYSDNLFSWALHKTSDREIAEDLVQDTFLVAVNSFDKFEGKSNPKSWLFAILNNKINDHYRSNFRHQTTNNTISLDEYFDANEHWRPEETPQPWLVESSHILDNPEFTKQFEECMQRLPQHWFSAIHLKYIEERKGVAICQEIGITPTNFWQILHRAKLQLRKCLETHWFKI